jgi:uridine kinase
MAVGQTARAEARDVIIVEGAYALHPVLREFFHLKVLVTVDPEVQKERILRRNGAQMLRRFVEEWIPLEQTYFEACAVKDCCDLIL